ncbi:glycosyltransferase [Oryzobacter telluris]|uniref:glycosyltransferase n=1 Tax=Oryzobacter telluris TaxID=3149179 RepID=UPI00370D80A6
MTVRVAVAMALYEPNPQFLRLQLDSLRAQEGVEWVAHVVDDGSSDTSFASSERLVAGDPRIVLHRSPENRGSVATFSRALALAAAEDADAVALADQDDIWHPERLLAGASALGPDVALVHSDLRLVDAYGVVVADSVWARERRWTETDVRRTVFRNSVTGCTVTVRPDVLTLALPVPAGGRPAAYHHDAWLALHALRLGRVVGLDRPLVDYRTHGENVVGVSRTGLVDVVTSRSRSVVAALDGSVRVKQRLATDFLQRVQEHPLRPKEAERLEQELAPFLGRATLADQRGLWAETAGNTDLRRRLLQWWGGLAASRVPGRRRRG